eukprot:scaffold198230_cov30-Tisochrysis_lutea.AAC.2
MQVFTSFRGKGHLADDTALSSACVNSLYLTTALHTASGMSRHLGSTYIAKPYLSQPSDVPEIVFVLVCYFSSLFLSFFPADAFVTPLILCAATLYLTTQS